MDSSSIMLSQSVCYWCNGIGYLFDWQAWPCMGRCMGLCMGGARGGDVICCWRFKSNNSTLYFPLLLPFMHFAILFQCCVDIVKMKETSKKKGIIT